MGNKATTEISIDLPKGLIEKEYFCDHCGEVLDDLHAAVAAEGCSDPTRHLNRHYLHREWCMQIYHPRGYRSWTAKHPYQPLDEFLAIRTEEERKASVGIRKRRKMAANPRIKFKSPSKPKVTTQLRENSLIIQVTIELPELVNADAFRN